MQAGSPDHLGALRIPNSSNEDVAHVRSDMALIKTGHTMDRDDILNPTLGGNLYTEPSQALGQLT